MNPFTLGGPQFLFFYAALALVVAAWCWARVHWTGPAGFARITELTADPYRIACLRAGEEEAVRVAVFNLLDRGLLTFNALFLQTTRNDAGEIVKRKIDIAILEACRTAKQPKDVLRHPKVLYAARAYSRELADRGLFAPGPETRARGQLMLAACTLLIAVAGTKVVYALMQGRSNVLILIAVAIFACFVVVRILLRPITRAGSRALGDLESLVTRLRERTGTLRSGGETNEALLVAAVHGLSILPYERFPFLEELFPRRTNREGESRFELTSCGSSAGSSCSSGCGGSCGGGCGGCGS